MTDRELLEKAAKAAGFQVKSGYGVDADDNLRCIFVRRNPRNRYETWNPLVSDGEALRLAVALGLAVIPYPIYAKPKHSVIAKQYDHARYLRGEGEDVRVEEVQLYGDDPAAATRRAIVRAAAAMSDAK